MPDLLYAVALAAALASGLMAGVFFAFSAFVMKALASLPSGQAIAAMQAINRAAITPVFMAALVGTAAACAALVVTAAITWGERESAWLLAGGASYLVGALGLTVVRHVPLNDSLAAVDPQAADADEVWKRYVATWTSWNHVRAAAALAAAGMLTVAVRVWP